MIIIKWGEFFTSTLPCPLFHSTSKQSHAVQKWKRLEEKKTFQTVYFLFPPKKRDLFPFFRKIPFPFSEWILHRQLTFSIPLFFALLLLPFRGNFPHPISHSPLLLSSSSIRHRQSPSLSILHFKTVLISQASLDWRVWHIFFIVRMHFWRISCTTFLLG